MKDSEYRKALLIGVDKYENLDQRYQLKNCVHDAKAIRVILEKHENSDQNFHTILCPNPTLESIQKNVKKVLSRNTEHVLIYFSGHGFRDQKSGIGYLASRDYTSKAPGVSMEWLMETISQSGVSEVTIILDCCHAASMGNRFTGSTSHSCLNENTTILAATQKEDVASEGRRGANSVFTKIIIQGLDGAAVDVFGNVTATSLYNLADSLLTPLEQRPVFKSVVTRMTPLRKCNADLTNSELRELGSKQFFRDKDRVLQLCPRDISLDSEKKETQRKLAMLLKFHRYGFLKCKDQLSIYEAALQSKTCELSPFGKFYWEIINKK